MQPHRGALILVFGILSLVMCPLCGVAAWSMGSNDLHEMATGRMDPSGSDLTKAGRICGMVGTGILVLQVLIFMIAGIGMVIFSN